MKETKLSSKKVYTCSFMSLFEDQVKLSSGRQSERIYLKHPGGAAMLATTKDNQMILIKQFRYPLDEIIYEIPAGKMDIDEESYMDCAIRELEEESGYRSNDVSFLVELYPCVGYSDEKIQIFRAKQAYKVEDPLDMDLDENIDVFLFTKEEIIKLLAKNEIKDGKTLIAIQYWLNEK